MSSKVFLEREMRKSYLDYAMSVIVSRAIPDVRDGLKPVHRRILYAMKDGGYTNDKPLRKSSRIVGDVMGKYHPHGDTAIYDAMVRMAQDFSMEVPLITSQGNFGSMDGDNAAAMRYTEAKLSLAAHALIEDIDKDTVNFIPNYDESEKEPTVLPAQFPNLLINGASGIAVGMATNIPPHNPIEVINACLMLVNNKDATIDDIMTVMHGPDFPTGATIVGTKGIRSIFETGRGGFTIKATSEVVEREGKLRDLIVFTDLPWQANKLKLVEEVSLLNNKTKGEINSVATVRDESNMDGVRVVVEVKRGEDPHVLRNNIYKHTGFQTRFSTNMLAISNGIPKTLNVLEVLREFVNFREEVLLRRTRFLLAHTKRSAYMQAGLAIALSNIDEIINIIKAADNRQDAKAKLKDLKYDLSVAQPIIDIMPDIVNIVDNFCYLSGDQIDHILDIKLYRLTAIERDKIIDVMNNLLKDIERYIGILNSYSIRMDILKEEFNKVKELFNFSRRTAIEEDETVFSDIDLIEKEDVMVTITANGYIKRNPVDEYRSQKRGGKGRSGMKLHDDDHIFDIFTCNTHQSILFFTDKGHVYRLECYKIKEGGHNSVGRSINNLISIDSKESITAVLHIPEDNLDENNLVFATKQGKVRRNKMADFLYIPSSGKIAIKLDDSDSLMSVKIVNNEDDVVISTSYGKCIRFPLESLRVFASRNTAGVTGIKLKNHDSAIRMFNINGSDDIDNYDIKETYLKLCAAKRREEEYDYDKSLLTPEHLERMQDNENFIITITSDGYGKITSSYEYRRTSRSGSGIISINCHKNAQVVYSGDIKVNDSVILSTKSGQIIRMETKDIRVIGRSTYGVRLFNVADGDFVSSVSILPNYEDEL